jgi:hypothetical protein
MPHTFRNPCPYCRKIGNHTVLPGNFVSCLFCFKISKISGKRDKRGKKKLISVDPRGPKALSREAKRTLAQGEDLQSNWLQKVRGPWQIDGK